MSSDISSELFRHERSGTVELTIDFFFFHRYRVSTLTDGRTFHSGFAAPLPTEEEEELLSLRRSLFCSFYFSIVSFCWSLSILIRRDLC